MLVYDSNRTVPAIVHAVPLGLGICSCHAFRRYYALDNDHQELSDIRKTTEKKSKIITRHVNELAKTDTQRNVTGHLVDTKTFQEMSKDRIEY